MAITKQRKNELLAQYQEWLKNSQAFVLTEYTGLTMSELNDLRQKLREIGGEFHIIKNSLGKRAFSEQGFDLEENVFIGSTALGVAFEDAPGLAKVLTEFAKDSDFVKFKVGYLGERQLSVADIQALADLPPLPGIRAQILAMLQAPASKLVRLLAEPAREVAAVIKAYSEQEVASAEA